MMKKFKEVKEFFISLMYIFFCTDHNDNKPDYRHYRPHRYGSDNNKEIEERNKKSK